MKAILKNKTILMMGAPGTGKGSYSKLLSKRFGIPVYSSGDHLRDIIKNPSNNKELINILSQLEAVEDIPKHFNNILSEGKLISKEVMSLLVSYTLNKVKRSDSNSIILDGYPRTVEQATEIDIKFKTPVDLVINIHQDNDIIIKKLMGRRNCSKCNAGFNLTEIDEKGYLMPSMKPKKENTCDHCGGCLQIRSDDNEASISERLKIYEKKCEDILNYYKKQKVLETVEMKKGFDDIGKLYELVEKRLL